MSKVINNNTFKNVILHLEKNKIKYFARLISIEFDPPNNSRTFYWHWSFSFTYRISKSIRGQLPSTSMMLCDSQMPLEIVRRSKLLRLCRLAVIGVYIAKTLETFNASAFTAIVLQKVFLAIRLGPLRASNVAVLSRILKCHDLLI